ncbi:MAG: hypothetical protein ACLP01_31560 [Solirubrobacteraceae bacterium]
MLEAAGAAGARPLAEGKRLPGPIACDGPGSRVHRAFTRRIQARNTGVVHARMFIEDMSVRAFSDPAEAVLLDSFSSLAIVHDYLNQPGGAERVVPALAGIWPDAPIYTSLDRVDSTFPAFGGTEARTSPLDLFPVDTSFRNLFPLHPVAFRSFGTLEHDLVISNSSGWANSIRTAPRTFHAVYCHEPARWLYGGEHLGRMHHRALAPLAGAMRTWDRSAPSRANLYIANSQEIRKRISTLRAVFEAGLHAHRERLPA